MAEKIYPASPQKRKEQREKGNVVKSTDIVTLATLFVSLMFIYNKKDSIFNLMDKLLYIVYNNINKEVNLNILKPFVTQLIMFLLPLLCVIAVTGFLANYFQVGLKFTPKSMAPDLKKINPINGFKRMFSKDSIVELGKSLLKVTGVLYIAITEIKVIMFQAANTFNTNVHISFTYIFDSIFSIVIKISILLLGVSLVDFTYKKYKFEKDLMMTKEEAMEEYKKQEGNPHTKNRQREFARTLTKKQIQKVKQASFVITNPTHFAVALEYDMQKHVAPVVLFKGVDEIALAAKQIAKENKIPMIENKPLARALYAKANEGDVIPYELWSSVADVINHIYEVNGKI